MLRKALARPAAAAVRPRPASTTLVLRDGPTGLDVLMVRRSLQASFMPGAYVFLGGAVDDADGGAASAAASDDSPATLERRIGDVTGVGKGALAYAVAGLRECLEECGLWLGAPASAGGADSHPWPSLRARLHAGEALADLAREAGLVLATSALQPWSHWVTPFGLAKRFDTLFFVVTAPPGQVPEVDAGETTALQWVQPRTALAAHAEGRFPMEFATSRTVESLLPFAAASVAEVLAHAAAQTRLPALHPRLHLGVDDAIEGVLLPGDERYLQDGYVA